jgi:hypothetical protein
MLERAKSSATLDKKESTMRELKATELHAVSGGFNLITGPIQLTMAGLDAITEASKAIGSLFKTWSNWLGKVTDILFH